jgi:nucleotide-binding universal stress UspA family protein
MIILRRILFPTDLNESSGEAMAYACELVNRFDAELHLLHVLHELTATVPETELAVAVWGDYQREMRESAERALKGLRCSGLREEKIALRSDRFGSPANEIVQYAKDNDIDLIVIGTRGRSGLAHVLLGSVAERVVRHAPCPVLTVRHKQSN